jgi:hypothetical protein
MREKLKIVPKGQGDAEADRRRAERHHERRDVEHRDADAVDDADKGAGADAGEDAQGQVDRGCVGMGGVERRHGQRGNHRGDGDNLADREIEAAGEQRQHLPHGDDGQIGRLPRDRDQILAGQEARRQGVEDDQRNDQQERQDADAHEQPLQRHAVVQPALRDFLFHQARVRSKKLASTRSCVISVPASSARRSPRYMT